MAIEIASFPIKHADSHVGLPEGIAKCWHPFAKVQGIAVPIEASWFAHIPYLAAEKTELEKLRRKHTFEAARINVLSRDIQNIDRNALHSNIL